MCQTSLEFLSVTVQAINFVSVSVHIDDTTREQKHSAPYSVLLNQGPTACQRNSNFRPAGTRTYPRCCQCYGPLMTWESPCSFLRRLLLPNPMRGDVGERRAMPFRHSGSMEATMLKYVSCEHGVLKIGIKSERNSTGVARTLSFGPACLLLGKYTKYS